MELTTVQIQQIEKYICVKRVDYIDLKIELLDHIISDVEHLLEEGKTFETAFRNVRLKWNRHFKKKSSFLFGMQYAAPKIILKKAVKEFRPFFFIYMMFYILPSLLFIKLKVMFPQKIIPNINFVVKTITLIALVYMAFIIYKSIRSKVKTTYLFILKTQYAAIIFLILPQFMGSYFNEKGILNGVFFGFSLAGISVAYICHYFYKKHVLEIAKSKKMA